MEAVLPDEHKLQVLIRQTFSDGPPRGHHPVSPGSWPGGGTMVTASKSSWWRGQTTTHHMQNELQYETEGLDCGAWVQKMQQSLSDQEWMGEDGRAVLGTKEVPTPKRKKWFSSLEFKVCSPTAIVQMCPPKFTYWILTPKGNSFRRGLSWGGCLGHEGGTFRSD